MIEAGIFDGDKVVVRPQQTAENGEIVVALLGDSATVKRLRRRGGEVWLMPENPAYDPIDGTHAQIVGKVCDKTPWESKCLVRALAAQRLLCRRGLSSTLYLGCGMEEGKMVAHAWLRFGEMYVTGGDGGGYTTVARFCKEASGKRG